MNNRQRRFIWFLIVQIQDTCIALIISGIVSLIIGVDNLFHYLMAFTICLIIVKLFHHVFYLLFSELTSNRFIRGILFGNNAKR